MDQQTTTHPSPRHSALGGPSRAPHNAADSGQRGRTATRAMRSLFRDREKTFWTFQVAGWITYGFLRMFNGLARGYSPEYIKPTIIAAITGFTLTMIMRYIYRAIRNQPLITVVVASVLLSGGFALVFSTIETLGHVATYDESWEPRGLMFFGNAMLDAYVLLSWTALYFGFNYYEMLRRQREQTLKASAMAHQAQLKMLRYQLNPHFLFNTLNAISTLVLDKSVNDANKMLQRLSAFLRYTLVNQPNQKVTLEQELYALGLYLEIEKVRFQDRLRIDIQVEDRARAALVPSLLMQPLIENAVKYAIAPSETGGTIAFNAHVDGDRLCLALQDDGPGLADNPAPVSRTSSGVGIANTRERLRQIYGDDHAFELTNVEPHGLKVVIQVPCEFQSQAQKGQRAA